MIFHPAPLDGVYVVEQERIGDERGFFARTWATEEFAACGLDARAVHMNTSFNAREGTVRGLHFQAAPHEEAKLVRATRGAIWDVAVDLREDSPTYRALARSRTDRGQRPWSLHPGRLRARLPEPDRCERGLVRHVGRVSARRVGGSEMGRSGHRHHMAGGATRRAHDLRTRSDLARPPDVSRVLVTGAGGFLGRHAVAALLERGHEVIAVTSRQPVAEDRPGLRWVRCDLLGPHAPKDLTAAARASHLLHLAWYAEHGAFWSSLQNLEWVGASLRLLQAFRESGGGRAVDGRHVRGIRVGGSGPLRRTPDALWSLKRCMAPRSMALAWWRKPMRGRRD